MRRSTASKKWFRHQPMMRKVEMALLPALFGAIYFFGWRTLAIVLWIALIATITEFTMARKRGEPVSEAVLVTALLLGLSLPPLIPFWQAGVGAVVAILFGKEVFGGFPRNVFNPAIVGRAFLYVCFPIQMTGQFAPTWSGWPGGWVRWSARQMVDGIQAVSAATPMWARRDFSFEVRGIHLWSGQLGLSFVDAGGTQRALSAGSVGEVSALLLLAGGAYLFWTRTAQWRLSASTALGATLACLFFRHVLGAEEVPPLFWSLGSGAFLYVALFMVTDPISAPKNRTAQWIYGLLIGTLIIFLRWKAVFAGAAAFAILLGNTVAPSLEQLCKAHQAKSS